MVFLSRGNTCTTNVHDPTLRPIQTTEAGATQYTYTCLVEYLKFWGNLKALYIHVCNKITTLIRYDMANLPIFLICMNNSIHRFIKKFL